MTTRPGDNRITEAAAVAHLPTVADLVEEHLAADWLDLSRDRDTYRELYLHTLGLLHQAHVERGRDRQRIADLVRELRAVRSERRRAA
jgi:hypothetical protein